MRALQLHYTSCRRGQSGNAGFQTRALTPGLRADEQREIERRGIYRPPRNLPPEPAIEEIERDFPRALRCYGLESGRRALTRCCYTGRDYSGRWGNFFAHTLLLEEGAAPPLWPVDYYEWAGWSHQLDPAEDTEQVPPPLPAAELDAILPAESFRLEELRDFLREQPGRRELLAQMGRAVLLGRETSRAVVVRDSATNSPYWIACVQKLFPPPHAWSFSSSSYQDDPRGCADLNATTGETGFNFDEAERRYRFYMFDLSVGLHSEIPPADDDYPAVAARWLAEEPDRLERFFDFMRRFDHGLAEPSLISALHLFELSEGPAGGPSPGGERLAGMISFASRHANAEGRAALLEILGSTASREGGPARPEDAEALIRFLAAGARETGETSHRAHAVRAWLTLVRRHLIGGQDQGLAAAEASWSCLSQNLTDHAPELAAAALSDPLWRKLDGASGLLPHGAAPFLLRTIWQCLDLVGRTPVWSQPEIESLLKASTDTELEALLAAVPRQPQALAAISHLLAKAWTPTAAGGALSRVLMATGPTESDTVRQDLQRQGDFEILIGEWLGLRDRSGQPRAAFEEYRRSVLDRLPALERRCGGQIRSSLLEAVPELERASLALSWLKSGEVDQFPDELATTCLALANRTLPLDPETRREDAREVAATAARLRIPLRPDRPLLRDVLTASEAPGTTLTELRLAEIRSSVAELGPEDYETFLSIFLGRALERAGTSSDHQRALLSCFVAVRSKVFERCYLRFFETQRKSPWPEPLQAALRFWLGFDPAREDLAPLAPLEPSVQKGIVRALSRLKPEKREEVRQNLKKSRLGPRSSNRWQKIEEALEEQGSHVWARFVGLFVRDRG
jgi:hypothetical protein